MSHDHADISARITESPTGVRVLRLREDSPNKAGERIYIDWANRKWSSLDMQTGLSSPDPDPRVEQLCWYLDHVTAVLRAIAGASTGRGEE